MRRANPRNRTRAGSTGALALLAAALAAPLTGTVHGAQLDTASFFKLQRGMNEGELLVRAGQPDLVTYPGVTARETTIGGTVTDDDGNSSFARFRRTNIPEVKQYHYIPDRSEHDPYLTIITLRGGLVTRLDRTKVFSRENLPEPARATEPEGAPARTDTDIQRERAERTYQAAQDYAETRNRLLERSAQTDRVPGDQGSAVYRRVDEDGSVYYGDRPIYPDDPVTDSR